jgi:light-regulated signal transduction histidine kinase (bacteriophytochrome)
MQLPGMHDPQDFYDISVSDNGIGFQAEYAEKIFEIFNRLHSKSQVEGTGIGLAICKKIIEGHHGRMTAEGKINGGAIFHIYLPVHKQEYSHRTSNEF